LSAADSVERSNARSFLQLLRVVSSVLRSGTSSYTSMAAELTALGETLHALRQEELHPSELRDVIGQLSRLRNRVDSLEIHAIRRLDTSGQWAHDGSRSPRAWVERVTHSSPQSAGSRVGISRIIDEVPQLAEVFAQGDTTREHLAALSRIVGTDTARRDSLPDADAIFAELAPNVRPGKFAYAVTNWAHRVDGRKVAKDHANRSEKSYLHVSSTFNGMVAVDGLLDPETGAALAAALKAARKHLARRATANAAPGTGSGANSAAGAANKWIPTSVRNAAALRHLLGLALQNPKMPTATGGIPVQVVVKTSIESLSAELVDLGVGADEIVGQGQIPAETVRRLACDCDVLPVVMNSKSQVLDVGRKTRLISPQLRLAIELRDSHCRWPECESGIQEIHHVVFWSRGGATDRANLVGLCRSHHHTVHERGFTLTGDADDRIEVRAP
jgi:hypothetical protein